MNRKELEKKDRNECLRIIKELFYFFVIGMFMVFFVITGSIIAPQIKDMFDRFIYHISMFTIFIVLVIYYLIRLFKHSCMVFKDIKKNKQEK